MLKTSLCDYSDQYAVVRGTITVVGQGADAAAIAVDRKNKQVIFKNCAPFSGYINEINNTKVERIYNHGQNI